MWMFFHRWFGWRELNIGEDGMPTDIETGWVASCFILLLMLFFDATSSREGTWAQARELTGGINAVKKLPGKPALTLLEQLV